MKEKIKSLKKRAEQFPPLPGVYLMKKKEGRLLYVGKAKSLKNRVGSYFKAKSSSISLKTKFLLKQIEALDYILTKNEEEAFLLEASLIKKQRPKYNIRLKDDKSYPYIRLNKKEDFPRFYFERRISSKAGIYFGPYTQGGTARSLLDFLNQSFGLRDCRDSDFKSRKKPCISYDTGSCPAPCVKKISQIEYKKNVQKALKFLKGESKNTAKRLESQIKALSNKLLFEEAGRLLRQLQALKLIEEGQSALQNNSKDRDVAVLKTEREGALIEILHFRKGRWIGNRRQFFSPPLSEDKDLFASFLNQYYAENLIPEELLLKPPLKAKEAKTLEKVLSLRKNSPCHILFHFSKEDQSLIEIAEKNAENHFKSEGALEENKKAQLKEIQSRLNLPKFPFRIECYDISHWSGKQAVGARAVFSLGLPDKKEYRSYHIKKAKEGDDCSALREVLLRRFRRKEDEKPQLILIDGGRGQLNAALQLLKELKISLPLAALAKDKIKSKTFAKKIKSSGERFFLPGRKNPLSANAKAFAPLLRIRDEAHRFALKLHRKTRNKEKLNSI